MKERCMGSWEGDKWVHILCPLVDTIGIPHSPHDVETDEYDPADEWTRSNEHDVPDE